jgi:hypothetical protein
MVSIRERTMWHRIFQKNWCWRFDAENLNKHVKSNFRDKVFNKKAHKIKNVNIVNCFSDYKTICHCSEPNNKEKLQQLPLQQIIISHGFN